MDHSVVDASAHAVPKPFRTFAVRSEEPCHAHVARAPYGRVHVVRTGFLDPTELARLAADGRARMRLNAFGDVDYASVSLAALASVVPRVNDLVGQIAAALRPTGVLGTDVAAYRPSVAARIDYLGSRGAGFHNDVRRHWTRCLFWNLTLQADDVAFVMAHAGVRQPLRPGDLVVFDPTMAHGLCRPHDRAQAVAASFGSGDRCEQVFLSGELPLTDLQWAALGSPWLPVEQHEHRGALDLMAAEFDERTGAIQRVRSLLHCMSRSTCYVDDDEAMASGRALL